MGSLDSLSMPNLKVEAAKFLRTSSSIISKILEMGPLGKRHQTAQSLNITMMIA